MKKILNGITAALLLGVMITAGGCAAIKTPGSEEQLPPVTDIEQETPAPVLPPEIELPEDQPENPPVELPPEVEDPTEPPEETVPPAEKPDNPKPKTATYLSVTADNVNIRSGAGTNYTVLGTAEKSTLYAKVDKQGDWYKIEYKNGSAYISAKYCTLMEMPSSENADIEAIIAEGTKCLGVPYVYGATRLHDGNGYFYSGFTKNEFDCSSLMQYIFYMGAEIKLYLNTRTQIFQGTTVTKSQLKRGDLMFFTNDSRKDNVGIERVGHVALYLGENWILHTASDYAKIEQISAKRWSYFIQGQRII